MTDAKALYLDLMKRCLTNLIYGDAELAPSRESGFLRRHLMGVLAGRGVQFAETKPFDPQRRARGRDWPASAHTMIGLERLDNLQWCVEDVLAHDVPGDLIETGVWRGGASILMRAVLRAHGVADRVVWLADSFEGLPPPHADKYPWDAGDDLHTYKELAVSLEEVQSNFDKYGLLDDQVRFLKGWFRDTLPTAPVKRLALLRLDGDMYESTLDALTALYPKLSPGGYVIVDDYKAIPACRQAVNDYRWDHGIEEPIRDIDWTGVYWQRRS
jgi:O-methyltransferase